MPKLVLQLEAPIHVKILSWLNAFTKNWKPETVSPEWTDRRFLPLPNSWMKSVSGFIQRAKQQL